MLRDRIRPLLLALLTGAVLLIAPAALAAEDRVLIEPGAEAVDRAALVEVVRDAERDGVIVSVAVLAGEPAGGAQAEADLIVDERGGAALVITPTEVGGVSAVSGHDAAAAVDAALDVLEQRDDVVGATEAFAARLTRSPGGVGLGSDGQPRVGGFSIPWVMIAVVGFLLLSLVMRGGRRRRHRRRGMGGAVPGAMVGYGLGRRRSRRRNQSSYGMPPPPPGGASRSRSRTGSGGKAMGSTRGGSVGKTGGSARRSSSPKRSAPSRSSGSRSRSTSRSRGSSRRR